MRALLLSLWLSVATTAPAFAQVLKCDMTQYTPTSGLTAVVDQALLVVTWTGQGTTELRARYAIERNQPVIRDLAVRRQAASGQRSGRILPPSTTW